VLSVATFLVQIHPIRTDCPVFFPYGGTGHAYRCAALIGRSIFGIINGIILGRDQKIPIMALILASFSDIIPSYTSTVDQMGARYA